MPDRESPIAPRSRRETIVSGAATAFALVVFLALAAPHVEHLVDDAYITFRYARHLVEGHGLVFNVGERVEGYTNFLWTILIATTMRLGISPESAARVLGLLVSAMLLVVYPRYVRLWTGSALAAALAPILLACSFSFAVWSTAGLETPLFALLVVLGVGQATIARRSGDHRTLATAAAALALAGLTRPEGVLHLGVIGALCLARPARLARRRVLAILVAVAAALLLPHALWRLAYYGELVPNTYVAKVGFAEVGLALVPRGLDYLGRFVVELEGWALLPALGLVLAPLRRAARERPWPGGAAAVIPALALLTGLLSIVLVGGDGLTAFRFVVPLLPFLLAAVAAGAATLVAAAPVRARVPVGLLAAGLGCTGLLAPHLEGRMLHAVRTETREVHAWRVMGEWIRTHTAPDATIAVVVAGAIPYVSGRTTIDLLGLTDRTIANTEMEAPGRSQAGHERSNVEYVMRRAPEYVVIGEYALHPRVDILRPDLFLFYRAERELVASRAFRERYEARAARTPEGYFVIFARRDVPRAIPPDRRATP